MDQRILEIEGWMHPTELEWLYLVAQRVPENALIVEIGAWMGRGSSAMYTGAGLNKRVVSVDTWKGSPDEPHDIAKTTDIFEIYKKNVGQFGIIPQDYSQGDKGNGIYYLKGDSVEMSQYFPDNSIDWVFIDGWHSGCARDIDTYIPKMKENSLISGHDFFCFYDSIQAEIRKRFNINQIIHSIWVRYWRTESKEAPPTWY